MLKTKGFIEPKGSKRDFEGVRRISLATLPRYGRRGGRRDGCQYMYCLPPAGGRIRSQGNYYCLPPAGGRIRSPRLN